MIWAFFVCLTNNWQQRKKLYQFRRPKHLLQAIIRFKWIPHTRIHAYKSTHRVCVALLIILYANKYDHIVNLIWCLAMVSKFRSGGGGLSEKCSKYTSQSLKNESLSLWHFALLLQRIYRQSFINISLCVWRLFLTLCWAEYFYFIFLVCYWLIKVFRYVHYIHLYLLIHVQMYN